MKSFFIKIIIAIAVLLLILNAATPARALNTPLPGQADFWGWVDGMTNGNSQSTKSDPPAAGASSEAATDESEPDPAETPEAAPEESAESETPVASIPEATESQSPAGDSIVIIDNSNTYNDNRVYYGTEANEAPEQPSEEPVPEVTEEPETLLGLMKQEWTVRWKLFRLGWPLYLALLVYAIYDWRKKRR